MLQKLTSVINTDSLYSWDVASILGTLQHLTFVYRDGCHALSSISAFLSKFPNKFVKHHLPTQARHHLTWWHDLLLLPNVSRSFEPLPCLDPDIWVNASSSWGLGLIVDNAWAASPPGIFYPAGTWMATILVGQKESHLKWLSTGWFQANFMTLM